MIKTEITQNQKNMFKERVSYEPDKVFASSTVRKEKLIARDKIRQKKDLEDDLTDLKKTVQFMARGFAGLWASLPQEMKDANPYKESSC